MSAPLLVAYGGGINSTAMLVGMAERGIRPDAILFADTGGERPETYAYVAAVSAWCEAQGFPAIVTVDGGRKYPSLEAECLGSETLPSIAYGFKRCSLKWKVEPQEQWARRWQPAIDCWTAGGAVIKAIGYHAGETHRSVKASDKAYAYRYFLREWQWSQEDCVAAVQRAGLPKAGKSACFFCPSTKPREILDLQRDHPDLFNRALTIERKARDAGTLQTVKGLGRNWAWETFVDFQNRQCALPLGDTDLPCGCYDGEDD